MLTLNANFAEEFAKAEVEAILVVQIYTAAGSDHAFCTGSKGFTFDTIQDAFGVGSLAPVEVFPFVVACTPINTAMDPYDRTVVKGTATVTLANHPHVRTFIKNNRLHARAVTVKLGTRNLTNEVHWASVFAGCIESVSARDDGIDLECKDFYRWRGEAFTHRWTNKHPLEVIKQLLLAQGVPEEYIDDDMFDPTHADYAATIGHYCITHSGHLSDEDRGPDWVYYPGGRVDMSEYTQVRPSRVSIQFEKMIQDFVKILVGCLFFDETGQVRFVRFNTAASAVVAWTDDDVRELTQLQTIMVNQIEISVTGDRMDYSEPYKGGVTIKDSTSQTNHAYPGESVGVFIRSDDFGELNWFGELHTGVTTTGAISPMRVYAPLGISGCRVPDAVYSNPWEDMQHATAKISGSKPIYVLVNDEVMKCISLDLVEEEKLIIPDHDGLGSPGVAHKPMFADLTISSGNRGALNTTAVTHTDPWEEDADVLELKAKIFDVTMHRDFALTQLQRFSNGCEIIELTTSLAQWAVQVGDFVTVTNSSFLAYGFDGVDTGHKWEIIEKELSLDDSNAQIRWKLAYATESSPPTIVGVYGWPPPGVRGRIDVIPGIEYVNEAEVGVSRHTVTGLGATSSGLVVTVGRGAAGCGSKAVPFKVAAAFTVGANKDHYFSMDLHTSAISIQTVATGAAQPALGRSLVQIAKVVAGGSTCTLTDLREFGAVRPRNMSTTDFEQGGNLIPNPDFETWSRGPGYPPDNWTMLTRDWVDDAQREETVTYSGNYAVNLSTQYATLMSTPFRVERNRVYQFGGASKPSASSGVTLTAGIRWLDSVKATISDEIMFQHTGNTTLTRHDVFTTAPDTAVYASAYCVQSHSVDGLYDSFRFVRAMFSFFVTNTTQTLPDGANTVVDFDIEAHDTGNNFNVTLGQNKYTAPFAGVYTFSAQVLGNKLTNGHIDSYLYLAKNGSELVRGSQASLVRAKPSSFLVTNTTQTLAKRSITLIDFDVAAHDTGGNFDVTLGQNKFTAPVAGTYIFSVQMLGDTITNGHATSYIYLAKNGSEVIRGAKGYNTSVGIYDFKIESVTLELAASDYVQVVYWSGNTLDSVFTGSTTQNFFSGGLIQETIADSYDYKVESGPVQLAASDYIQVVYHNGHASDSVLTGSTTQNYFSGAQIA